MNESTLFAFWPQLHPLGKALVVGGSLCLAALRLNFFSLSENNEKYLRSFALGTQIALMICPLFLSSVFRGRVDLALWFWLPFLWCSGALFHFALQNLPHINVPFPLRDYSLAAIVGFFVVPWAPIGSVPSETSSLLWGAGLLVFILASELRGLKTIFSLIGVVFISALVGFFTPSMVPLFVIFLLGVWTYGLFREMLVLFSFFPEGNKRFVPALVAFGLTMAFSLAWA